MYKASWFMATFPLSQGHAGSVVRIRQLTADESLSQRLREMGFCEDRIVRLVNTQPSVICLVCKARLAISVNLAEQILVEPISQAA